MQELVQRAADAAAAEHELLALPKLLARRVPGSHAEIGADEDGAHAVLPRSGGQEISLLSVPLPCSAQLHHQRAILVAQLSDGGNRLAESVACRSCGVGVLKGMGAPPLQKAGAGSGFRWI